MLIFDEQPQTRKLSLVIVVISEVVVLSRRSCLCTVRSFPRLATRLFVFFSPIFLATRQSASPQSAFIASQGFGQSPHAATLTYNAPSNLLTLTTGK